jgi:glycosyltransferase involved in cell wall biosynthesis
MEFSVIIPAKNEEANIARCLDSLRRMEYDGNLYEVIVVDNGSSDKTVEIARQKGAAVYVQPAMTISGLRNFGAGKATGKILAFLDADCAVSPQWLMAASYYLGENVDIVAFGSPVIIPENGTWVQKAWFKVRGRSGQMVSVDWLESANLFVKRSAFTAVNGFNDSLVTCEDYDLTQRLRDIGILMHDPSVLAIHYREPATIIEFLKKELWRGKSNYKGIVKRKIDRSEIPSVVFPIIYALLCMVSLSTFVIFILNICKHNLLSMTVLILSWQIPILLFSWKKARNGNFLTVLQLLILFNVYFFARSLAVLQRN